MTQDDSVMRTIRLLPVGEAQPVRPSLPLVLRYGLCAVAYFAAQTLAFKFPDSFGLVAPIWPASGIALASLLLSPQSQWPALLGCLFAAGMAANLTTDRPLVASVGFMIANVCETAGSAWLATWFCGDKLRFARIREVLALAGAALFVNSAAALVGAGAAVVAVGARFWPFYWTRWVADGLGLLLVTPLVVVWGTSWRALAGVRWQRAVEISGLFALGGAVAWLGLGRSELVTFVPIKSYLLLGFVIWAALRAGPRGTVTLVVLFSVIALVFPAAGIGAFRLGGADIHLRLLSVQVFLGVVGLSGMLLAAAVAQASESQTLLRAVTDGTSDAIYVKDRQGRYLLLNPALARFVGKTVAEVIGKDDTFLFPPQEARNVIHGDAISMAAPGPRTYEEYVTGGSGEPLVFFATKGPLRDKSGRVIGLFGIARDITERKQVERALRNSEDKFSKAFKACPEGITIASMADGKYIEANDIFLEATGFHRDEVIGHTSVELGIWVDPNERKRFLETLRKYGFLRGFETQHRMRSGEVRDFLLSSEVIELDRVQCSFSFMLDVTERKRAEAEKARVEAQLQQAQKMESVGRLAGGVAHDFNNTLGAILGHVEMAIDQVDPKLPIHADLEEIRKVTHRSADLTRQLLAFARKQTVAPKVLDLNQALTGTLKMLKRLLGEEIDLSVRAGRDLWLVKADPSQIDQVLANLCVNARDAITGVGRLIIETENRVVDRDYAAAHPGVAPGEYVELTVADNGCGMDPETQSHIFEPFFTTKGVGKGTGLGLATVYGAVKQNGGFIEFFSQPGQGTTFTIYLPRHMGHAVLGQEQGMAAGDKSGRETILLVEDEPVILKVTKARLEKLGYTILAASTAGDALRLARIHAGAIRLLLTDVVMPDMNGRNLAKEVKAISPRAKCLYMSGYTADVIANRGVLDEGVSFIQKPFSSNDLAAKVRQLLDGVGN
jgi:PAS domain S-box-containing protein